MLSKFIELPCFRLSGAVSDTVLLWLVLVLTALNGIAIDLFTPSLPAIGVAFQVSAAVAKSSISVGLIGFAFGVMTLGMMSDTYGRRRMIITGLSIFIIASVTAVFSSSISMFMMSRFFQGVGVATAAMLSRAMLLDHFSGKKLYTAMLYTTIAWGLGPVVAPFIGGYLQVAFGWQMNFIGYAIYGSLALLFVALLLPETLPPRSEQSVSYIQRLYHVFSNKQFNIYALLTSLGFIQYILYNLVGSFLVEDNLGYTAITFGHTALIIGLGYFFGALCSRFFIRYMTAQQAMSIGMVIIAIATIVMFVMGVFYDLTLWGLVFPLLVMIVGTGIVLPNAIAKAFQPFKENAGTAASMHGGSVMLIGCIATSFIGHMAIHSILPIAWIVLVLFVLQVVLMVMGRNLKNCI